MRSSHNSTLEKISAVGIVAVVRSNSKEEAIKSVSACIDGGIPIVEVTFTTPEATEVIRALRNNFENERLIIGAGSVLDSETARIAILEGASFIVSPTFDKKTAMLCNRYQIPYIPGCMTPTEILRALDYGLSIVKLFPATAYKPDFMKAIIGPLPQVNFIPTGGINLDNIEDWIKAGAIAVGIGGDLFHSAKESNYHEITRLSKLFVSAVSNARKGRTI